MNISVNILTKLICQYILKKNKPFEKFNEGREQKISWQHIYYIRICGIPDGNKARVIFVPCVLSPVNS